ncbi:hypothetical protein ACOME3_007950 [Neoechinorhynchus agilis]
MELLGRRTLIVYSCGCMTIISGLMPLLIALNASFHIRYLAWITVSLIMAYVACFAIGMGPIPYIYASEVFRHDIRNKALVSGLLLNYSFNLIVSLVFPLLNNLMGGYVFLVFMVIMAAQTTLYFFKMAETKNKSIEEIEEFWTKGKTDNDIREEEDVQ